MRSRAAGRRPAEIPARQPGAQLVVRRVHLADLGTVKAFADGLIANGTPLDVLINNAGVMAPPTRMTTVDRFELQFGSNFLDPFALTMRLLPLVLAVARHAPVVCGDWRRDVPIAAHGQVAGHVAQPEARRLLSLPGGCPVP